LTMCSVLTVIGGTAVSRQAVLLLSGHKQPFKTLQSLAVVTRPPLVSGRPFNLIQPIWDEVFRLVTIATSSSAYTSVLYFWPWTRFTNAAVCLRLAGIYGGKSSTVSSLYFMLCEYRNVPCLLQKSAECNAMQYTAGISHS
jgi:hypothetical protein